MSFLRYAEFCHHIPGMPWFDCGYKFSVSLYEVSIEELCTRSSGCGAVRVKGPFKTKTTCVVMRHVWNAHDVLSGGTDISFQSVMNSDACTRKEWYAECRVVGGTAVFQGLVVRMTCDSTVITRSCVSLW